MNRRMLVAETIVLVTAVVACLLYVVSSQGSRVPVAQEPPLLRAGSVLPLQGHDWSASDRHVVLFVESTCPASNASAEFYRELSRELRERENVSLVVVSAEDNGSLEAWLASNDIEDAL